MFSPHTHTCHIITPYFSRDDEFSVITSNSSSSSTTSTTTTTTTTTSPHSSTDIVNSVPMTSSSTASGYTSSSSPTESSSAPEYAFSFAELLSAITAEFVFNVAGDHILFPVAEDRNDDQRLHTTAIMVAELLQKLHITPEVYRILNTSAVAVAQVVWKGRQRGANPVARVLQLTVEAAMRDPLLRDEYLAVKTRLANQIYSLPPQHGKFASTKSQTLYDVMADQLVYAEKLMKDARVKKLFMSVSFFKASQFDEASVPVWVRNQTSLARAMFQLARQSKWRNEVQRVFDEAVIENLEKYDAMAGDDESFFQALQEKIEQNVTLNAELKKMGSQFALSKT